MREEAAAVKKIDATREVLSEMKLGEFQENSGKKNIEEGLTIFHCGKELADFLQLVFSVNEQEADILLEYTEGYGNTLGCRGDELMRLVAKADNAEEMWQSYDVQDMVYAAYFDCETLIETDQEDFEYEQSAGKKEEIKQSLEYHQNNKKLLDAVLQRTDYGQNSTTPGQGGFKGGYYDERGTDSSHGVQSKIPASIHVLEGAE